MPNQSEVRALVALWQRHDWRENIFAPGIAILQALLRDGATASGAGCRRETALQRCLGETAEWHALALAGGAVAAGYSARRDGLAAHPDPDMAKGTAMLEAFERFAVTGWWSGRLPAVPVAPEWVAFHGLSPWLAAARHNAAQKRQTGLWQIMTRSGPVVAISRSTSAGGQQPVLGFGCDPHPRRAAEKALREMLLMEINLIELLAAGSTGTIGRLALVRQRIESYARRCPVLLPALRHFNPGPDGPAVSVEAARHWFGAPVELRDMTPGGPLAGPHVAVWLCRPTLPDPDPDSDGLDGSPFL